MEHINQSIACNVENCAHHAGGRQYCTLDTIQVGRCAPEVCSCDNTECASFKTRSSNCGCR